MKTTLEIMREAKEAAPMLGWVSSPEKNRALTAMADALEEAEEEILAANAEDVEASRERLGPVMTDRLRLTPERIRG
ncbi:MAG: gamma-glutamyl-phosphate reductase, partial [Clostridia bacterium]|nr:gamma-glutamyl-phosphate reductase [Clostridia bacterium]